jgi:hypothetical protein
MNPEPQANQMGKKQFSPMFMHMNPSDRKFIKRWNFQNEDGIAVIRVYAALVGEGLLEFFQSMTGKYKGAMRLYPEDNLICIEIKVRA